MKLTLLPLLLILSSVLTGQTFIEDSQFSSSDGLELSSIAFADVDGDNDQDLLVTGTNSPSLKVSTLYLNDGAGNFSEMSGTPFEGVDNSTVDFADVDGDNDLDVLITGSLDFFSNKISKLYTNDGEGNFAEVMNTPFDPISNGAVAFIDVDGDNDLDLLMTGSDESSMRLTKLYTNDGIGNFTQNMGTPFDNVSNSSIAFADVDGDNDQDVLIAGGDSFGGRLTKLYSNDGSGNFTEMLGTPFDNVHFSSIAFTDVDSDTDFDLIITGRTIGSSKIAKLYLNDGAGNFTEKIDTPFEAVENSAISLGDLDGDDDQDLLLTGINSQFTSITKLYTNDGAGNFTEVSGNSLEGVADGSVAFADVDGDNDQDIVISGFNTITFDRVLKLYLNEGTTSTTDDFTYQLDLNYSIYPNPPVENSLNISLESSGNEGLFLKVFDPKGVLLIQENLSTIAGKQSFAFDITSLTKGIYFVQLDNTEKIRTSTFVVQ